MEGIVRKTAEESQELIPAPGSCLRIWGRPAHCLFLREEMALVTVCFPVACLTSSGERKKRQRGTKNSSVLAVAAWGFCWVLAQDISLCSFATCCLWNGCDSVIALCFWMRRVSRGLLQWPTAVPGAPARLCIRWDGARVCAGLLGWAQAGCVGIPPAGGVLRKAEKLTSST